MYIDIAKRLNLSPTSTKIHNWVEASLEKWCETEELMRRVQEHPKEFGFEHTGKMDKNFELKSNTEDVYKVILEIAKKDLSPKEALKIFEKYEILIIGRNGADDQHDHIWRRLLPYNERPRQK